MKLSAAGDGGALDAKYMGHTLCIRPVQDYEHAKSVIYREYQQEAHSLMEETNDTKALVKEVEKAWETLTGTSEQQEEMGAVIAVIKRNLESVQTDDKKPFPNFITIKDAWNKILKQTQNLRILTLKVTSKDETRRLAESESRRLAEVITKVRDNENDIRNLKMKNEEASEPSESTLSPESTVTLETTEEPDEEDGASGARDDDTVGHDEIEDPDEESQLQNGLQRLRNFCEDWEFDCRIVMMMSVAMTAVWGACTIVIGCTICQTIRLTRKMRRVKFYLDLKSSDEKQERRDDEIMLKKETTRYDVRPNPTRNFTEIKRLLDTTQEYKEDKARQKLVNKKLDEDHKTLVVEINAQQRLRPKTEGAPSPWPRAPASANRK